MGLALGHQIAAGALHPADRFQAHGPADGHQVRGPGSGEVHPGTDFDHPLTGELRLEGDRVEKEAVGQDQPQPLDLLFRQLTAGFDIEAVGEVGLDLTMELDDGRWHGCSLVSKVERLNDV